MGIFSLAFRFNCTGIYSVTHTHTPSQRAFHTCAPLPTHFTPRVTVPTPSNKQLHTWLPGRLCFYLPTHLPACLPCVEK